MALGLVVASCSRAGTRQQTSRVQPIRGDRVVVEQTAAAFYEARVLEVSGQALRLQTEGGELLHAQMGDVYPLGGSARGVRPGALAICRASPGYWVGCRVESVAASTLTASDASGGRLELKPSQLVVPTAVTLLNLEHHFSAVRQRTEFESAFGRAGRPMAPPGWKPSPSEKVVARLGPQWFSATVHEVTEEALCVAWTTGGQTSELTRADVVPQPAPGAVVVRGSYGLARPRGPAQPWVPVRVLASTGDALTLTDAEGRKLQARPRDILPLVAQGS